MLGILSSIISEIVWDSVVRNTLLLAENCVQVDPVLILHSRNLWHLYILHCCWVPAVIRLCILQGHWMSIVALAYALCTLATGEKLTYLFLLSLARGIVTLFSHLFFLPGSWWCSSHSDQRACMLVKLPFTVPGHWLSAWRESRCEQAMSSFLPWFYV